MKKRTRHVANTVEKRIPYTNTHEANTFAPHSIHRYTAYICQLCLSCVRVNLCVHLNWHSCEMFVRKTIIQSGILATQPAEMQFKIHVYYVSSTWRQKFILHLYSLVFHCSIYHLLRHNASYLRSINWNSFLKNKCVWIHILRFLFTLTIANAFWRSMHEYHTKFKYTNTNSISSWIENPFICLQFDVNNCSWSSDIMK